MSFTTQATAKFTYTTRNVVLTLSETEARDLRKLLGATPIFDPCQETFCALADLFDNEGDDSKGFDSEGDDNEEFDIEGDE